MALAGGTAVALVAAGPVAFALTDHALVGPRADGSAYTPLGQLVRPAGAQTNLGDLPLGSALSPDGKTLLVSNDGQATQSLQVVDVASGRVVQTIAYKSPNGLFSGVAFSPDGTKAYAAGGGANTIHTYAVAGQQLTEGAPIALPTKNPAGATIKPYPAGLAVTPDGSRLVVADHLADAVSVVTLASGAIATVPVGHAPEGVAVSADGSKAWVSNQGANTLSVVSLGASPAVAATVEVGVHPNAVRLSRDGRQVFVADGDSDQLSLVDTSSQIAKSISLAPYSGARAGSSPFGIAQSADGASLYVTMAGNNAVDVVDLSSGSVTGRIPTAWYPTGVEATASRLLVLNAKGLGAGPNNGPGHPDPTSAQPTAANQYAGSMMVGTLSSIALPLNAGQLTSFTNQVSHNDGFDRPTTSQGVPAIKHVIYVLQENRTFDQVFGSLGKGNGDPSLNLFGDESATNQRALERRFATLDNFYADAEISAQGWNWGVAANSNAYSETMWPSNYSGRGAPYPSENDANEATVPNRSVADGYIWQRLAANKVSFRNYGFYVSADPANPTRMVGSDPVLDANTDHAYRGFDMSCPDNPDTFKALSATCGTPRFSEWKQEFDSYVANGNLPTVELLRLPNDHTSGTRPGSPTPRAYVADNDLALGRVVDAVSHSPYWKDTAIVVTEDDAQNGPDHVDAHRTIAQVISPYTQTGAVDSTLYSTASMLRTIENIVGIAPMTQFDSFATPLVGLFAKTPDNTAYSATKPADAANLLNGATAPLAATSAKQDLTKEDQIDMAAFNQAIWQSVKGADNPMPAPVHNGQ